MTALLTRPPSIPNPSPSRSNPFARPRLNHEPSSFTRSTLLPTLPSPQGNPSTSNSSNDVNAVVPGSAGKARQAWRLDGQSNLSPCKRNASLKQAMRVGITFFTFLAFPVITPSVQTISNPFDVPIQPQTTQSSPFALLPSADTDLCLSLESMRGRKFLQVRGFINLPPDEILDGSGEGGIQMYAFSAT